MGFGSFSEYAERSFGYKPRSTQEKLRVAETLEELPLLTQALEQGTLHWSAVRELTRVAVAENEREWLAVAQGKSLRQLEELVAGRASGDNPTSPQRPSERRHVLRFEVAPETFALFREAMSALRRSTDGSWDDDAALLALARLALGGPCEEGRASYQIAITVCGACGGGHLPASGELVPIDPEIVAMAHCDGQHIGRVAPSASNDAHVGADVQVENPMRSQAGTTLVPPLTPVLARATQTIPPAVRRAVFARDHRRCRVPGCRSSSFLDVHHIELRSEGGPNDPENLLLLCGAHHRASHRGQLTLEGTSTSVRFRHADGSLYGRLLDPHCLEAKTKTFSALRNLGFRETEVRAVLAHLQSEGQLASAPTEQWLRAALASLTRRRSRARSADPSKPHPSGQA